MSVRNDIISGLEDAIAYAKGDKSRAIEHIVDVPDDIDVKEIRDKLEMSQQKFALQFGFSLGTVRNWEQGIRRPEGPARVLLTLIQRIPEEVKRALQVAA